ncbi:hypothetical protein KI387_018761, partial [Taxus chinensis]
QKSGNLEANILYQDSGNMNHFMESEEEDEIPILIELIIPFRCGIDHKEAWRNLELQQDNLDVLDDVRHEEDEMVLNELQAKKSTNVLTRDEE